MHIVVLSNTVRFVSAILHENRALLFDVGRLPKFRLHGEWCSNDIAITIVNYVFGKLFQRCE